MILICNLPKGQQLAGPCLAWCLPMTGHWLAGGVPTERLQLPQRGKSPAGVCVIAYICSKEGSRQRNCNLLVSQESHCRASMVRGSYLRLQDTDAKQLGGWNSRHRGGGTVRSKQALAGPTDPATSHLPMLHFFPRRGAQTHLPAQMFPLQVSSITLGFGAWNHRDGGKDCTRREGVHSGRQKSDRVAQTVLGPGKSGRTAC